MNRNQKLLTTALVLFTIVAQGQTNKIENDGNVGIGTLSPAEKLSVRGNLSLQTITGIDGVFSNLLKYGHYSDLESGNSFTNRWHGIDATISAGSAKSNKMKFRIYPGTPQNPTPIDVMTLSGDGNVGIGTISPIDRLSIRGSISLQTTTGIEGVFSTLIKYGHYNDLESGNSNANRWHGIDATISAGLAKDNQMKFRIYPGTIQNPLPIDVMTLNGDGNVGIGTNSPKEKLSVNGKLRAHEVKVETNNWPDYVFEADYKKLSLTEVEKYIQTNKHLPGIPSAKMLQENGLELGRMVELQQQKIEELTLHMIEKDKSISILQKEKNLSDKAIDDLKKRLTEIEIIIKKNK